MEHLASLLRSLASLAWPFFAFTALFVFRLEIKQALSRLRKGEILGQKFEFTEELMKLEASATAASREVQELPSEDRPTASADEFNATVDTVLQRAASTPKIALMILRAELEKQTRQALATRGLLGGRQAVPVSDALSELLQYGFPPNLTASLKSFDDVVNKFIHGTSATDDDALRALDSGMTILRALNALPNEVNIVYDPGVEVFSDAAATKPISNAKGVILETTAPGGAIKTVKIFPTTRTHFQKGKQVAWEWNLQKTWPEAWYRDPDTGAVKQAWVSSAEFIGRHLEDI